MQKLTSEYILRRIGGPGPATFSTEEFRRLFSLSPGRAYGVLHRLTRRGVVCRLRQGRYLATGFGGEELPGEPLFLGTQLVEPSYIGFWSALHHYGWTDQAPRVVFVANARRSGRRELGPFRFQLVRVARRRFFGYRLAREGSREFPIAEPEKAILDALYLPRLVGGMEAAVAAVGEALGSLGLERLEEYAARMAVPTVSSRLGYILAGHGVESGTLQRLASRAYVKMDPEGPRRGRFVSRWRIIDNRGAA